MTFLQNRKVQLTIGLVFLALVLLVVIAAAFAISVDCFDELDGC